MKKFKKLASVLSAAVIAGSMCCANLASAASSAYSPIYYVYTSDYSLASTPIFESISDAVSACKKNGAGSYVKKYIIGKPIEIIFVNGDINMDNKVSTADLNLLRKAVMTAPLTQDQARRADIDNSGIIDLDDLTSLSLFIGRNPNWCVK